MKKNMVIGFLTLLSIYSAQALEVSVNNLNIGLMNGKGKITTDNISLRNEYISLEIDSNDLEIQQDSENLIVTHQNANAHFTLFKLEKQVAFFKDLNEIFISGSNLSLKESLNLWASQVEFTIKNDKISFNTLALRCPKISKEIAESCLDNSSSSVSELSLPDTVVGPFLASLIGSEEYKKLLQSKKGAELKLKDFLVDFNKKHFNGSVAINILFNINFTFSGDVNLELDKKQITISNFEVYQGMLPVTKVVLTALKEAKIKGIAVSNNNIVISF